MEPSAKRKVEQQQQLSMISCLSAQQQQHQQRLAVQQQHQQPNTARLPLAEPKKMAKTSVKQKVERQQQLSPPRLFGSLVLAEQYPPTPTFLEMI